MANNQNQMPDMSQLSLQNSSPPPPRSIGRFEQHANTFDGVRVAAGGYHYSTSPQTQNLGPGGGMQNATIATSPLKQGKPSRAGLPSVSPIRVFSSLVFLFIVVFGGPGVVGAERDGAGRAVVFAPSDERYFVRRDVPATPPFADAPVDGDVGVVEQYGESH